MFSGIRRTIFGLEPMYKAFCNIFASWNTALWTTLCRFRFAFFLVSVSIVATVSFAQVPEKEVTLVLGVRTDAPPFSSCIAQSEKCFSEEASLDHYVGFSVDICKRIAEKAVDLGIVCDYIPKKVTAKNRFAMLQNGAIDILCGATTVTLERMRIADFSLFTFVSGMSVMYKETPLFIQEGKRAVIKIGYLNKTTSENVRNELMIKVKSDLGYGDDVEIDTNNPQDDHYSGVKNLLAGDIHAYLADREILLALKENNPELVVSKKYFTIEPYAIGLNLEKPELRFAANSVLSELFGDGMSSTSKIPLLDLLRKHFPGSRFSKSLTNLYRSQRLSLGSVIADPIHPLSCPSAE